jgi:mRNA interferase MazF
MSMHVALDPPEGGLKMRSYVMPDHVRSVSTSRLTTRLGAISPERLEDVRERLRILLDL